MINLPIKIDRCTPSPIGLTINEGIDVQQWKQIGHTLCRCDGALQWWIGDWINYGQAVYGEKYKEAIEVFGTEARGEYGYGEETLRQLASTAKRVHLCNRLHNLSWTHHHAVSNLDDRGQRKWLKEAQENNWSVRDLIAAMRGKLKDKSTGETNSTADVFLFERWINEAERGMKSFPVTEWEDDVLTKRIQVLSELESKLWTEAERRNLPIDRVKALEGV